MCIFFGGCYTINDMRFNDAFLKVIVVILYRKSSCFLN